MLGETNAVANLAVTDVARAKTFYERTLGLREIDHMGEDVSVLKSGDTVINVYRSDYAGTNKATAVTWAVGDKIDSMVRELKTKGVTFEHYDLPETALQGDIHVFGDIKVAWFKDPDGNILNLVNK